MNETPALQDSLWGSLARDPPTGVKPWEYVVTIELEMRCREKPSPSFRLQALGLRALGRGARIQRIVRVEVPLPEKPCLSPARLAEPQNHINPETPNPKP